MQWSALKTNCNEDFISEFPGESSLKTTNTANNTAPYKEEIEKGKLLKSQRNVKVVRKIIRNITKQNVRKN